METSYQKALEDAETEMREAMAKRAELDKRIAQLRLTINSLAQLCEGDPGDIVQTMLRMDLSLTDACREVLRAVSPRYLTAVQVKRSLEKMGFDVKQYSNPLASIYPTLNRLAVKGELEMETENGKHKYRIAPLTFLERIVNMGQGEKTKKS